MFDYWVLQRKSNPILPPTAYELKTIKRQKVIDKAARDAIRDAIRDEEDALKKQAETAALIKDETTE